MTFLGVKCYICSSGVSWTDCESHQKAHNCPYMYDQCLTLSKEEGFANTSKLFHKKCTSNRLCTAYNPTCEGPDVIKCDFSCCMGNYCNTASRYSKLGIVPVVIAGWVSYMFDWAGPTNLCLQWDRDNYNNKYNNNNNYCTSITEDVLLYGRFLEHIANTNWPRTLADSIQVAYEGLL